MNNQNKLRYITQGASIASLYIVLTFVSRIFGLDSGAIQLRVSEALIALVAFTPAAIPGLFLGCIISNFLMGGVVIDVIFGSLATLIGVVLGYRFRKNKVLVFLPNIISNTVIVPIILSYAYGIKEAWWYMALTVGIGEILSCGVLGYILLKSLEKSKIKI